MIDANTLILAGVVAASRADAILSVIGRFAGRIRQIPDALDTMADHNVAERAHEATQAELIALAPVLKRIAENSDRLLELAHPNGDEEQLPMELRGKSQRSLLIWCISQIQSVQDHFKRSDDKIEHLAGAVADHIEASA